MFGSKPRMWLRAARVDEAAVAVEAKGFLKTTSQTQTLDCLHCLCCCSSRVSFLCMLCWTLEGRKAGQEAVKQDLFKGWVGPLEQSHGPYRHPYSSLQTRGCVLCERILIYFV